MILLTASLLKQIFPKCKQPETWVKPLNDALLAYEINTTQRIACFLAQVGHESGGLTVLTENLNYSASRLMSVWPKRFPSLAIATQYERNPEKLANNVYANRMGNGDEKSGDGYRYRGRGLLQLTGKSNYDTVGKSLKLDLLKNPDLLLTPSVAALSAAYYWKSHGCNELADDKTNDNDNEDFIAITKKINGGTIGLKERLESYKTIFNIIYKGSF